jgi:DNA sulfur modification protein DndE
MRAPAETIRISKQGRDHLIKLRRQTGIEHWNVLCRWAFCVSLREKTPPPLVNDKLEGGVEMTWKVFAGEHADVYSALCNLRTIKDGFANSQDGIASCLRAHLHRGLSYLASGKETKSLCDLANKWLAIESQKLN